MKQIVIVDGHNLLFKMFYGIPTSIKNSKGKEIKGLVGFLGSLKKLVDKFQPYSLIVIFDSESSKEYNLLIDSNYKSNRKDYSNVIEDDNPFSQLPLIKKALNFLNIDFVEVQNNEADDYIASFIHNSQRSYKYFIVSNDTDFIQLIDNNTFLYVLRGKNSVLYNHETIIEKYHVVPSKYVLFKALVGDKSDNIDGIKGIGEVTASTILKYDSIEEYILNNKSNRISILLEDNKLKIEKNVKLITLKKDIDTSEIKIDKLSNNIYKDKVFEIIEKIGER